MPVTKVTTETFTVPGHFCEIISDSQSCLPKLPPQANQSKRFLRWIRKKLMVSRSNPRARSFLKSQAATKAEKRRQLRAPWYIIHPFSHFAIYREIIMSFLWMIMFTLEPLMISFRHAFYEDEYGAAYILMFLDFCVTLNIAVCFVMGYHISKTKEIILSPRKIAIHYLHTYFIVDVLTALPSSSVMSDVFKVRNSTLLTITAICQLFCFCRAGTMLVYFRQTTLCLGISDMIHEFICLILMTIFTLHWLACTTYLVPSVSYFLSHNIKEDSWTYQAGIPPHSTDLQLWKTYGDSYFVGLSYFIGAGYGGYVAKVIEEEAVFSFMYILGHCYLGYVIAVVFEVIGSTRASESKYEEIIHQLNEYMSNKQLPHDLRKRLLLYYKSRFHMRYFRETVILSSLSEQQRTELFLYSCKELIESAKIFHSIPKTFIGNVMSSLKSEVYLTNDVILRAGTRAEAMFFIDKGTVAEVLVTGKEVRHLEDGQHFGEIELLLEETKGKRVVNYVAVQVTECYRLDKKDLINCVVHYEEFGDKIKKQARERYELLLQMEDDEDFIINRKDVLYDLRSGKIIEQPRNRMPIERR